MSRIRYEALRGGRAALFAWRDAVRSTSKGRRQEIVDDREHHQKDEPGPEAKADELLLDRQQRLGRSPLKFGADIGLRHGHAPRDGQPAGGGVMPLKKGQEVMRPTQITNTNRLTT